MTMISGSKALVTGGARGIGKLTAEGLLRRGAEVVLVDRDELSLRQTAGALSSCGRLHTRVADLSRPTEIAALSEDVLSAIGPIDILVNNAGIVRGGLIHELDDSDHELTLRVNTLAVILMTKYFLPPMLQRGRGHIVNIASASSFGGVARMASYAASKWAVLGFSESLIYELQLSDNQIQVTSICPGFIDTGMFDGASPPLLMPLLKPEKVASAIVQAIERDERIVIMPPMVRAARWLKFLPDRVTDFLAHRFGINQSMNHWEGH